MYRRDVASRVTEGRGGLQGKASEGQGATWRRGRSEIVVSGPTPSSNVGPWPRVDAR